MKTSRILMGALAIVMVAAAVAGCKKEKNVSNTDKVIKTNAVNLSLQHDQYVRQMLDVQEKLHPHTKQVEMTMDDVLDVIEEVIGVRLEVWNGEIFLDDPSFVNLDDDGIYLANHSYTQKVESYLSSIDQILQDMSEDDDLSALYPLLDNIESNVLNDYQATNAEKATIINAMEVLKGSLLLWRDIIPNDNLKVNPSNWSWWKKTLFVATADAVGAALGGVLDAVIVINGVGFVVPAGTCTAVSAALLSYAALCVVGWAG